MNKSSFKCTHRRTRIIKKVCAFRSAILPVDAEPEVGLELGVVRGGREHLGAGPLEVRAAQQGGDRRRDVVANRRYLPYLSGLTGKREKKQQVTSSITSPSN